MSVLLIILYVLVCVFLILVVLLQQGKGADLAGAFGGGGSQTSFGPRSASNIMHRMTTGSFVLFVVLSLALAILSGKQRTSVMDSVEASAPAAVETTTVTEEPAVEPGIVATGDEQSEAGEAVAEDDASAEEENVPPSE